MRVKCIDNKGVSQYVTVNNYYNIVGKKDNRGIYSKYILISDNGSRVTLFQYRFSSIIEKLNDNIKVV
jgi:hypothetical protein